MTARYGDADVLAAYTLGAFDDVALYIPEDCACRDRAILLAGPAEYGQVDITGWHCRAPEDFRRPDGSLGARVSCSLGRRLIEALADAGFGSVGRDNSRLDAELLRRMDEALRPAPDGDPELRAIDAALALI